MLDKEITDILDRDYDPFSGNLRFPVEWWEDTEVLFMSHINNATVLKDIIFDDVCKLISILIQIASTLYMAQKAKNFIHGDMRDCNVLITYTAYTPYMNLYTLF